MQERSLFSTRSPGFFVCRFFDDGHSDWCEVISHCSFDLYFSNNERCSTSFHVFIGHWYVFFGEMSVKVFCWDNYLDLEWQWQVKADKCGEVGVATYIQTHTHTPETKYEMTVPQSGSLILKRRENHTKVKCLHNWLGSITISIHLASGVWIELWRKRKQR